MSAAILMCGLVLAQVTPPELRPKGQVPNVKVESKLGGQVPLELGLKDETGAPVLLGRYFGARPVVLALVYYECPMLCTMILQGLVRGLRPLSLLPGTDFDVVVLSINPKDTPAAATRKKKMLLAEYARAEGDAGWHFLTGREEQIAALARAVGLGYVYQPEIDQYAHAAAVTILTPEGKVARYLYGVDYAPRDLKLAIAEASQHRVSTLSETMLLLCFHYDPVAGKYGFAIVNAVKAGGVLTVLGLAGAIFAMVRVERKRKRRA